MSPRILGILVGIVSLIWASLFTYTEIIDADPDQFSIKSATVKQEFANCSGNFQQRQACAEEITNRQQQIGFLVWCKKVAIILGPPLILYGLVGLLNRQRRMVPAAARAPRRTAGDNMPRRVRADSGPLRNSELDARNPDAGARQEPRLRNEPEPPLRPHGNEGGPAPPTISGGRREPVRRR